MILYPLRCCACFVRVCVLCPRAGFVSDSMSRIATGGSQSGTRGDSGTALRTHGERDEVTIAHRRGNSGAQALLCGAAERDATRTDAGEGERHA